jgi:glycine dehydrogenase subunit 1
MTLLGEKGLRELAMLNHGLAVEAADRLSRIPGVRLLNDSFFNEFTLVLDRDARAVVRQLADRNILGGVSLGRLFPDAPDIGHGLVVTVTETCTSEDVEALAMALDPVLA